MLKLFQTIRCKLSWLRLGARKMVKASLLERSMDVCVISLSFTSSDILYGLLYGYLFVVIYEIPKRTDAWIQQPVPAAGLHGLCSRKFQIETLWMLWRKMFIKHKNIDETFNNQCELKHSFIKEQGIVLKLEIYASDIFLANFVSSSISCVHSTFEIKVSFLSEVLVWRQQRR